MSDDIIAKLRNQEPLLWLNPGWRPTATCLDVLPLSLGDIRDAEARLQRFAPLLAECFPELQASAGIIESALLACPSLSSRVATDHGVDMRSALYVKADHALPVAGSVKARGGLYAVLHHAEKLALESALLHDESDDYRRLRSPAARELFAKRTLSVGSTGNLGLSIGIMGAALGFKTVVHMSREAKEWKKKRLREHGVTVVEHESDYTAACVEARKLAREDPYNWFIDDERSTELFLGYSVAVLRLKNQLERAGVEVSSKRPLFLYLPCGVGGGPGGIAFAARHVFGDNAHCFFIEPVQAPCMLLGMSTGKHADISIYDIGLTLKTDADGLAVSRPSRFVGELMEPLLSGCLTVDDNDMYLHLAALYETEALEVEPSSAAALAGPLMVYGTKTGMSYQENHAVPACPGESIHVIWTTGGLFVPPEQHEKWRQQV
jgi:D-serine ammonia-lyase